MFNRREGNFIIKINIIATHKKGRSAFKRDLPFKTFYFD